MGITIYESLLILFLLKSLHASIDDSERFIFIALILISFFNLCYIEYLFTSYEYIQYILNELKKYEELTTTEYMFAKKFIYARISELIQHICILLIINALAISALQTIYYSIDCRKQIINLFFTILAIIALICIDYDIIVNLIAEHSVIIEHLNTLTKTKSLILENFINKKEFLCNLLGLFVIKISFFFVVNI